MNEETHPETDAPGATPSPPSPETSADSSPGDALGPIFASLLLRLWLAVRAIQTGVEKYAGTATKDTPVEVDGEVYDPNLVTTASSKAYSIDNYHGVPKPLMSKFESEPLLPEWALGLFDKTLGPILILLGLTILLGVASRISLFVLGLVYVGLTWGLILINQNDGVAWLASHIVLIALALHWAKYDRFKILKKW